MYDHQPPVELQQYSPPTQVLEYCLGSEFSENGKLQFELPGNTEPTEFLKYESAAHNSSNPLELKSHLSSEMCHQQLEVSEFQVKDSDQTEKYETDLEQSCPTECNSEKDLKDEKMSENIITSITSEENSCELDATKHSPIKNVPKTPLSPAEITSIVNGGFTLRPLFRAFWELEENSLVCDVIYEEDELDYEDVLSETDYSTESDTMSIEDEFPDTINGNKVSDDCTTVQNTIKVQNHLPVHEICELALISTTSIPVYVESNKSDLTREMYEICDELHAESDKHLADELSSMDNSGKVIEKNVIKELSGRSREITENKIVAIQLNESEFDLNIKDSKINENAVEDEIGFKKFNKENHKKDEKDTTQILNKTDLEEIKYGGSECLVEEESKLQTEKKSVTRCVDVFRRVLRKFGNLLFPCLKRKI
ncbi:uncharacterized protein [Centruroides vittatus]|uniref:uncharacterized protein isoform X1 n=1 Tax=Centruroides vittatus TaxID=120091 RepID=UPI00350F5B19